MQLFKNFLILFLVFSLSLSPLVVLAYFNDQETSNENSLTCGKLDFALETSGDFAPVINSSSTYAIKNIEIVNLGTINFFYQIETSNASGTLCDYLNISANLNGSLEYSGNLTGFFINKTEFQSPQLWQFSATLSTTSSLLENTSCNFDFVFNGYQATSSLGFSDQEIVNNTINSGSWVTTTDPENPGDEPATSTPARCVKINEIYYNPDSSHGNADDEWVEIYNACSESVNLKNWSLRDNHASETINQNYIITPGQFVVIAANASTWSFWPLIPSNAAKIAVGGTRLFNGLNNDGDRVFLFDNLGNQIDEVSWGNDSSAFSPSVANVAQGHSIARKVKGVDTDTANDWEDLASPNPGTNPHSLFVTVNNFVQQMTEIFNNNNENQGQNQGESPEDNQENNGDNENQGQNQGESPEDNQENNRNNENQGNEPSCQETGFNESFLFADNHFLNNDSDDNQAGDVPTPDNIPQNGADAGTSGNPPATLPESPAEIPAESPFSAESSSDSDQTSENSE